LPAWSRQSFLEEANVVIPELHLQLKSNLAFINLTPIKQ